MRKDYVEIDVSMIKAAVCDVVICVDLQSSDMITTRMEWCPPILNYSLNRAALILVTPDRATAYNSNSKSN